MSEMNDLVSRVLVCLYIGCNEYAKF